MQIYQSGGRYMILNAFRCWGSVFPYTMVIAAVSGGISSFFCNLFPKSSLHLFDDGENGIMLQPQAWHGFSFLLGFLIVFRTTQAYSRFWEGTSLVYRMQSEWYDAMSSCIAFTKYSDCSDAQVIAFRELLIRLCSMLHAAALAELEGGETDQSAAYQYAIIDPDSMNESSLARFSECDLKVDLVFQWMQNLIIEQAKVGLLNVPPPLLTRVFQEMANGMVAYHDALKLIEVPFPFPYAQACDSILLLHWLIVPIVTSQWVTNPIWAFVLCFFQVFILWSLNFIAIEIDQPFGTDANDIDGEALQTMMNDRLQQMVDVGTLKTPWLVATHRSSFVQTPSAAADARSNGNHQWTISKVLKQKKRKSIFKSPMKKGKLMKSCTTLLDPGTGSWPLRGHKNKAHARDSTQTTTSAASSEHSRFSFVKAPRGSMGMEHSAPRGSLIPSEHPDVDEYPPIDSPKITPGFYANQPRAEFLKEQLAVQLTLFSLNDTPPIPPHATPSQGLTIPPQKTPTQGPTKTFITVA